MPNKVPEKAKPKTPADPPTAATPPSFAPLFQLEDIATSGRKLIYGILSDLLGDTKGGLPVSVFVRHCLHASPQAYASPLIEATGARKMTPEKLVEELNRALSAKVASSSVKLDPAFQKLIHAAQSYPVAIGAVTMLTEGAGEALFNRLALAEFGVWLQPFRDDQKSFPGPDTWLKTAKALGQRPRNCGVLSASMAVCKSALSADMRCVAVPDEFTAFQDYSGADVVLEKLDDRSPKELLDILFPLPAPVAV
jgi:beta-phosphoglucomutase-like phosphatase (HAD superfamily)